MGGSARVGGVVETRGKEKIQKVKIRGADGPYSYDGVPNRRRFPVGGAIDSSTKKKAEGIESADWYP